MAPELVEITGVDGTVLAADWLARAEAVHRQLRPSLPADYAGRLRQVFASGGRMVVAAANGEVRAVGVWRLIENTYEGRRLYVDDLVADEAYRSLGWGKCVFDWLERRACDLGCDVLVLDSGIQRAGAHKFYFREGMSIASYSFRKNLL